MEPKQIEQLSQLDSEVTSQKEQIKVVPLATQEVSDRIQSIKEEMASNGINLTAEDLEGLKSYLATKKKWEEVYRRLADS